MGGGFPPRLCVCQLYCAHHSVLKASQEPQVENLQLVVQLHAHNAIISINAQQDPCCFTVLSKDHLDLDTGTKKAQHQQLFNILGATFQRIRVPINPPQTVKVLKDRITLPESLKN